MADNELDVANQVQKLMDSWNPPPEDKSFERLVGVPTEPGDVAATAHVRADGLDHPDNVLDSHIDAQRHGAPDPVSDLPPVPEDDDGDPDYDSMKNDDLKAHLSARNLPVSGKHADLVERLEADDADDEDDDSDDE